MSNIQWVNMTVSWNPFNSSVGYPMTVGPYRTNWSNYFFSYNTTTLAILSFYNVNNPYFNMLSSVGFNGTTNTVSLNPLRISGGAGGGGVSLLVAGDPAVANGFPDGSTLFRLGGLPGGYSPGFQTYNQSLLGLTTFMNGISYTLISDPFVCFLYDTKILTNYGYIPIQELKVNDMVKTLKDGYKPITMIEKKDINHIATQERIQDQLYKCSKTEYPELFEDLVITGCHSILVEDFASKEQEEKTIQIFGEIFITDNLYRLPASADERATVYEKTGIHTIYHFALEHPDYYMNYGVYANGLLVESCSERNMKEVFDSSQYDLYYEDINLSKLELEITDKNKDEN